MVCPEKWACLSQALLGSVTVLVGGHASLAAKLLTQKQPGHNQEIPYVTTPTVYLT